MLFRSLSAFALAYLALSAERCFFLIQSISGDREMSAKLAGRSLHRSPSGQSYARQTRHGKAEVIDLPPVVKEPESELMKRARTEVLPMLAERSVGNRKLRAAIESIELDQEAFRMSTPLFTLRTFLATSSAAAVSGLATLLLASRSLFVLAPSLTTIIFLYSSYAESAAARFKAKAKFNYGQSSKIASTAEGSLATAEARKVFFPFGVGLTAITAAACVTLRIFNEKVGDFFPEPAGGSFSTIVAGDNLILIFFALASVAGASVTSLTYVSTRAALVMDDMRQSGARSDWEATRLPKIIKDPSKQDERNVVLFTILFCILPLPFLVDGFDPSLADTNRLQDLHTPIFEVLFRMHLLRVDYNMYFIFFYICK